MTMTMAQVAIDTCKASGYRVSVAIVGNTGELLLHVRGDGASPHTVENSFRKAYTSRTFRVPSGEWAKSLEANPLRATMFLSNMIALAGISLCLGARLIVEYRRGESQLARQRVRVVMLGTLLGFALPGAVLLGSMVRGGGFTMNLGAVTPVLFSLSLAYAVVKHDLFAIDAMVKRGAYYLVTTGAVLVAYAGAVALLNMVFRAGALTEARRQRSAVGSIARFPKRPRLAR